MLEVPKSEGVCSARPLPCSFLARLRDVFCSTSVFQAHNTGERGTIRSLILADLLKGDLLLNQEKKELLQEPGFDPAPPRSWARHSRVLAIWATFCPRDKRYTAEAAYKGFWMFWVLNLIPTVSCTSFMYRISTVGRTGMTFPYNFAAVSCLEQTVLFFDIFCCCIVFRNRQ